jgi:predicted methyltransferase
MIIDSFAAQKLLFAHDEGKKLAVIDFDLGFTQKEVILRENEIEVDNLIFPLELIEQIAKKQAVFELSEPPKIIAFYDERYYKLEPIENSAPTLEIDGIRMHRTKMVSPLQDAENKVMTAGIQTNDEVLDICTGLGYTAISAMDVGARVTTIEKDPNVIEIAKYNPYSRILFEESAKNKIKLIMNDACKQIKSFEEESFDIILHDPPRFSLAGELYSKEFYRDLYRILRKGGRLLHYVGNPGSKYRGKDFVKGVQNRLTDVGFSAEKVLDGESVLAFK